MRLHGCMVLSDRDMRARTGVIGRKGNVIKVFKIQMRFGLQQACLSLKEAKEEVF